MTEWIPVVTGQDLFILGILFFLEGILSLDNALVLAILAKPLSPQQQKKALTYGLIGAFGFRFLAISMATFLIKWNWVKFVGGAYLLWVALSHFFKKEDSQKKSSSKKQSFWKIVLLIELTDIAFALDSILAAVALTQKFWLILLGGMMGVLFMRFAASLMIGLLDRFPHFERTAYLLILLIGVKIVLEGFRLDGFDFHSPSNPAFLVFWSTIALCVLSGFLPKKKIAIFSFRSRLQLL